MTDPRLDLGLAPVRSITKREQLLEQFLELFRSGKLRPGMKLPPERELAEMLNVSRPTIREMIKALSLLGLVESIQGSGTIVKGVLSEQSVKPSMFELALQHATFQELTEMRRIIEPELAALAAERATDEDIAAMDRVCKQYERYAAREDAYSRAQLVKLSHEFHTILAQSAGNRLALECLAPISSILMKSREESARARGGMRSAQDHRVILDAIRARDPESARRLMKIHLDHVSEDLHTVLREREDQAGRQPPQG